MRDGVFNWPRPKGHLEDKILWKALASTIVVLEPIPGKYTMVMTTGAGEVLVGRQYQATSRSLQASAKSQRRRVSDRQTDDGRRGVAAAASQPQRHRTPPSSPASQHQRRHHQPGRPCTAPRRTRNRPDRPDIRPRARRRRRRERRRRRPRQGAAGRRCRRRPSSRRPAGPRPPAAAAVRGPGGAGKDPPRQRAGRPRPASARASMSQLRKCPRVRRL